MPDHPFRHSRALASLALGLALAPACVTSGTYNRKVAELTKLHDDDATAAKQREQSLNDKVADLTKQIQDAEAQQGSVQARLDNATQLIETLTGKLEKLGQNVDALTKEKGKLSDAMTDATARLEELRKAKAAAEARAATFHDLIAKLHAMIDSGQLKVQIREGRMIIALPNDILFDSGETAVKQNGKAALAKVAQVLASVPNRNFLIAGHTDNVPIKTALFPSNWELSTRRAVEVVHYLITQGMDPKFVAAAGYGEFDPVASNDTAEHRAQNRRIEIVLQPNLSDLPPLDDLTTPKAASK
jgi:chemotaxis protein MotB